MEPITGDELLFFDRMPAMLPVYEALRTQLLARCPGTSIKVSRSQISFRSKYIYAMASLPVRRRKDICPGYHQFRMRMSKQSPIKNSPVWAKQQPSGLRRLHCGENGVPG